MTQACGNEELSADLRELLPDKPQGRAPWVLVDVRTGQFGLEEIDAISRSGRARPVAIIDRLDMAMPAYERGALATVPPDAPTILACIATLERRLKTVREAMS